MAGIDTTIFLVHSVRGAASSKAVAKWVPIQSILNQGYWARESMFADSTRESFKQAKQHLASLSYGIKATPPTTKIALYANLLLNPPVRNLFRRHSQCRTISHTIVELFEREKLVKNNVYCLFMK